MPGKKPSWKSVGADGKVITEVLADVGLTIGPRPRGRRLVPQETQNRFNMVFRNFARVFARAEHPVIFLDDLQWVDLASIQLLKNLISDSEMRLSAADLGLPGQ